MVRGGGAAVTTLPTSAIDFTNGLPLEEPSSMEVFRSTNYKSATEILREKQPPKVTHKEELERILVLEVII
jgi:hypothetical protein